MTAAKQQSWYMIRTNRADKVDVSLKRLARLLSVEKDVPVSLSQAVRIAIEEAIDRRKEAQQ